MDGLLLPRAKAKATFTRFGKSTAGVEDVLEDACNAFDASIDSEELE